MTAAATDTAAPVRARRPLVRRSFQFLCVLLCLVFLTLGSWQVQRRQWKLALIARTNERVHASPVAPPASDTWQQINAADFEYRHLTLRGHWLAPACLIHTQALTELGSGFWQLQPLELADGSVIWINQGFVPTPQAARAATAAFQGTGLLRISEPGGSLLRKNEAQAGHWYSRDIAAITAHCGLPPERTAPYFVDMDASAAAASAAGAAPQYPVPGLTVIQFHNSHAVYAITWVVLALMVAWAAWRIGRPDAELTAE